MSFQRRHGLRHFAELGALHAAATTRRKSSETLPDDFCNYREGRAHPANFENLTPARTFQAGRLPIWAASGETPVLAAGASRAPVHRPEDIESASP
jgi:hypothetical protein